MGGYRAKKFDPEGSGYDYETARTLKHESGFRKKVWSKKRKNACQTALERANKGGKG